MTTRVRHYTSATLTMLLGTVIVFGVVITMNELASGPDKRDVDQQTSFQVKKQEKQPPPPPPSEPEPQQQPDNPAPPPPLANLDSAIGSVDIPLPGVDMANLSNLGDSSLSADKNLVMTDDTVDTPPRPVKQVPMQYPPQAKAQGVEGYVVVSLLISQAGEVQKVRVLESEPGGVFEDVAVEAIRGWRFEPAQYQGESVKVWARQRIQFDLS
jgi:protein TonB